MPQLDRRYLRNGVIRALRDRMAKLEEADTAAAVRIARVDLPLLVLGGTNVQSVVWARPMPSENYQTYVALEGILGKGSASVSAQTAAGLTITTTASALISVGSQLLVIAWTP